MEQYLIPALLIAGFILAAVLTRWINWYTWGANQAKYEALKNRREVREAMRKELGANEEDNDKKE